MSMFDSYILNPTYDDLLAKGYIKMGQAIIAEFSSRLISVFGINFVKIAPIKELQRCKAKLTEYKHSGVSAPYAAWVCDYLRATVLCESLDEMATVLHTLANTFTILRIKQRIGPTSAGNKVILVILVNVVVDGKEIKPIKYPWSNWWDGQHVRMITEVGFIQPIYFFSLFSEII